MLPQCPRRTRLVTVPLTCSMACPTRVTGTRLGSPTTGRWLLGTAMIQASTLSGKFSGGTDMVTIYAVDYNTGAYSSHSSAAGGGTIFTGSSSASSTRTPTSLMTEWYHPSPSETSIKQVTYSESNIQVSNAWICIGEYVPPNPNSSVYSQCTGSPLTLTSRLQQYSYHGLITDASQYEFQTGPS